MPRKQEIPSYCCHKATGQAVVRINGRDVYLGKFGTAASKEKYGREIAEWQASGRLLSSESAAKVCQTSLTISELILAFLNHAQTYYVKNGKPTSEQGNIKLALRPLRRLYGNTSAKDFGPLALKAVRQAMIDAGLCRRSINRHVQRRFIRLKRAQV
jgi:hypothetical protein